MNSRSCLPVSSYIMHVLDMYMPSVFKRKRKSRALIQYSTQGLTQNGLTNKSDWSIRISYALKELIL